MDKIFFKTQDRLVDFNVAAYEKFSDMASDSTLQLNLRNYHLLNFSIVSKKNSVTYYLKTLLKHFTVLKLSISNEVIYFIPII